MTPRVVVVGGTGGFGRLLVQRLLETTDLEVIVASRRVEHGQAVAASLAPGRISAIALDATTVTAAALRRLDAGAIVNAAGPFQGGGYRLPCAAIQAGLHYIDLADGRAFVAGFVELDGKARAAGVAALTGASSTPALSHAVLDRLTAGWRRIDHVEIAIVPGNRVGPRGLSVVQAILSYVGKPVRVLVDGRFATRPGWGMLTRRNLPGLGHRWLSLCETPDLDLVPARFAPSRSAVFRAGLELPILHLGLWAASLPVRAGWLSSLLPFARLFRWIAARLARFGTNRGGMLVEAAGLDRDGVAVTARWSLLAEAGHGPYVPILPALALLRAMAEGRMPQAGARPCVGILDLAALEYEFAGLRIETAVTSTPVPSPFQAVLAGDFAQLPQPVSRWHSLSGAATAAGQAEIEVARGLVPRLLAWIMGLPASGRDVPVTVSFRPDGEGGEHWSRRFGRRHYASQLRAGPVPGSRVLHEYLAPFRFAFRLTARPDGLAWQLVAWRLLGMPLPRWTLPRIRCFESADADRFVFDIDVAFPIVGPVIHYRGWLLPGGTHPETDPRPGER